MSLLHVAAYFSTGEMATLLLDHGAAVMAQDKAQDKQNGNVARVCVSGNHPALCAMLDHEPRLMEARDGFGFTPLLMAVYQDPSEGHACAMELLHLRWSLLHCCAISVVNGFANHVQILAATSITVDGTIALDAFLKDIPAVRSLLTARANPLLQDSNGCTARDWAASTMDITHTLISVSHLLSFLYYLNNITNMSFSVSPLFDMSLCVCVHVCARACVCMCGWVLNIIGKVGGKLNFGVTFCHRKFGVTFCHRMFGVTFCHRIRF